MDSLNYIVLVLYFLGLIAVSWLMSRRIKSSEDMFIAGRSSSWWLSGMSTYMTIFSASTFVVWGGVAFRSGLVAVIIGNLVGVACLITGRWVAGKWRQIKINSPGDFIAVRFGKTTVDFYTIAGIIGRGVHTGVALYAIAVVMSTLMTLPEGHILADANGHLSISCAVIILGVITLIYTVAGGFLAVLMTDVIQFGVLIAVVLFMIPLSLHAIGGLDNFINSPSLPSSYFDLTSTEYPWIWLILWTALNVFQMGGDWPFVQRYISVPTARDARRSNYLVGILYLFTPVLWYLPAMVYRTINPDANPEQAYILMSQTVLMKGMLGVMLAAMISATLSCVSGTLNVYANVFTYQIYGAARPDASDKSLIKAGRIFTVAFGVAIIAIALLIPLMGGAERVVVTILTMVIAPLFIPSVWGLFSRRINGRQVIMAMIVTYVVGITLKFTLAGVVNNQVLEATIGLLIPVAAMAVLQLRGYIKGYVCPGYTKIEELNDPQADVAPDMATRKAVKSYSFMAINCFLVTLGAIGCLLLYLLGTETYDKAVTSIMWQTCMVIAVIIAIYLIYRIMDARRTSRADQPDKLTSL